MSLFLERPYCANSKPDPQYVQQKENVTVVFHVYSYILSSYQWSKEDEKLNQSLKHQFSSRSSRFEVNIFGRDVQIETIVIYLEIVDVTKKDLDASYILKVYNPYGNKTCIMKLQEGSTFYSYLSSFCLSQEKDIYLYFQKTTHDKSYIHI